MTSDRPTGQPFGRYLLQKKIASGGMGEVYLAKTTGAAGFEKQVVIKKILPHLAQNETFVQRFIDEAKIVVQLNHGNIASVIDMGIVDGDYYIAMEYVDGRDLRHLLKVCLVKNRRTPPDLCLYIIAEVLKGLSYAHNKADANGKKLNIVHRDVSPSNILISREGAVLLLDFGIAKAADKLSESISGALHGKFIYMSPEQAVGASLDPRSDLFSLGLIAYEMITGKRPFEGGSDLETLERVKSAPIDAPSSHDESIPTEVDAIVMRALDRDKEKRYQTAESFQMELMHYLYAKGSTVNASRVANFFKRSLQTNRNRQMSLDDLLQVGLSDSSKDIGRPRTLTQSVDGTRPQTVLVERMEDESQQAAQTVIYTPSGAYQPPRKRRKTAWIIGIVVAALILAVTNLWTFLSTVEPEPLLSATSPQIVITPKPKRPSLQRPQPILPTHQFLKLVGVPEKAVVTIDGRPIKLPANGNLNLALGTELILEIKLAGRRLLKRKLPASARPTSIQVEPRPRKRAKRFEYTVVPADLIVKGRGVVKNNGRLIFRLSEGETRPIELSKRGYLAKSLRVSYASNIRRTITLVRLQEGTLVYIVRPAQGTTMTICPAQRPCNRTYEAGSNSVRLSIGNYVLKATRGKQSRQVKFSIKADAKHKLFLELTDKP